MLYINFQGHQPFGSEEEDFLWEWWPSWLYDLQRRCLTMWTIDRQTMAGRRRPTYPISSPVNLWLRWAKNRTYKIHQTCLILRGHPSPPIWSKNIDFLANLVQHYLLCCWYTMSSVLLIWASTVSYYSFFLTGSTKQNQSNTYPVTGFPTKVCLILTYINTNHDDWQLRSAWL